MLCARVIRGMSSMDSIDDAGGGHVANGLRRAERIGETDDGLTGVQPVGRWCRPDLEQDVGGERVGARDDGRALGGVGRVREAGGESCSRLDRHLQARLGERGHASRD